MLCQPMESFISIIWFSTYVQRPTLSDAQNSAMAREISNLKDTIAKMKKEREESIEYLSNKVRLLWS